MASLTDRRGGFAIHRITLQGGDDIDGSERLGAWHLRRQIGADELGRRSIATMSLHDGIDVEGLPEVALTITNPPFGEVGLGELLVQRKLDHRAGGLGAARESQRGQVALELDLVQFAREQASADVADGRSRVQAPGEQGVGRRPFERGLGHDLGDGGVDFDFAVGRTQANGFEVRTILAVELLGDRHERGDGSRGLEVTQGDGDLATDGGRLVLGHGFAEGEHIAIRRTQGAESHQTTGIVGGGKFLAGERHALVAELGEQPDGTGSDVRIGVGKQRCDFVDDLVTRGLEAIEASGADVGRRTAQRGDLAGDRREVDLRDDRLEPLRGDAVDRAGETVVARAVTAHARIEPVGDIDGTIRTDADVGRTEHGLQRSGGLAAEEV